MDMIKRILLICIILAPAIVFADEDFNPPANCTCKGGPSTPNCYWDTFGPEGGCFRVQELDCTKSCFDYDPNFLVIYEQLNPRNTSRCAPNTCTTDNPLPSCGDNVCNGLEDPKLCPIDCIPVFGGRKMRIGTDVYNCKSFFDKNIAMTFEGGPTEFTDELLDILKENKVPATFFIQGNNARLHAGTIKRMVDEGHTIGHNSWDGKDIKKLTEPEVMYQFERTNNLVNKLVGKFPRALRTPDPNVTDSVLDFLQSKYKVQFWTYMTEDWLYPNDPELVVRRAVTAIRRRDGQGSFILVGHDRLKGQVEVYRTLLPMLRSMGFGFIDMESCLASGPVYSAQAPAYDYDQLIFPLKADSESLYYPWDAVDK